MFTDGRSAPVLEQWHYLLADATSIGNVRGAPGGVVGGGDNDRERQECRHTLPLFRRVAAVTRRAPIAGDGGATCNIPLMDFEHVLQVGM